MDNDILAARVEMFLTERGILLENGHFQLDSLDYLALLLHLETTLHLHVKDDLFFAQGTPEVEIFSDLCQRLAAACS
jgi:hypothetical protein